MQDTVAQVSEAAVRPVTLAAGSSSTPSSGESVYLLVIGIIMLAVSLTQLVDPRLLWRARAWSLRNPAAARPPVAGFVMMRAAGAVVFSVGLLIVLRALRVIG